MQAAQAAGLGTVTDPPGTGSRVSVLGPWMPMDAPGPSSLTQDCSVDTPPGSMLLNPRSARSPGSHAHFPRVGYRKLTLAPKPQHTLWEALPIRTCARAFQREGGEEGEGEGGEEGGGGREGRKPRWGAPWPPQGWPGRAV